ncbi:MAG: transcriptional regulator [Bacteroidia bacterium]|nr:transcriptional regulator [Bacteroidia bacterium]MDW8133765.1 transcriptional regulator [Bacteroidia bacterium]
MYQPKRISLNESQRKLIELWGRLAHSWGVGPTMAQIFALLYIYPEPLDTDSIIQILKISRGNVSINLRKLLEWGLVTKTEIAGSRRALYTAQRDIWLIAVNIIQKRFEREITPIQNLLKELLPSPEVQSDSHSRTGLAQIQEVIEYISLAVEVILPLLLVPEREHLMKILRQWQKRKKNAGGLPGRLPDSGT